MLILVEGLPGTGKSTIAEWLAARLPGSVIMPEGDERIPLDFYGTAGVPLAEFSHILTEHPDSADELNRLAKRTESYVCLRIDRCPADLQSSLRRWDMGDENNRTISVSEYVSCALERLAQWVETQNDEIVVIDSGYLQNPLNELLFRGASNEEAKGFITEIALVLTPLRPVCVYLRRENADVAIDFAKQVKGEGWAVRVDELLTASGIPDLFTRRFDLELELVALTPHIICDVNGRDWTVAKHMIDAYFGVKE